MGVTAYYSLQKGLNSLAITQYRQLELLATGTASRLDQLIIDVQRLIVQVSSDPIVINFLSTTQSVKQQQVLKPTQRLLKTIVSSHPGFDAAYLLDTTGKCLASSQPKFVGQEYAFREYFRTSIRGELYVSSLLLGQTTGQAGIHISYPVRSNSGDIIGVIVIKSSANNLWKMVNRSNINTFLIDDKGIIISHPNPSVLFHSVVSLSPVEKKQMIADRSYGSQKIENLNFQELAVMVRAKEPGHVIYSLPNKKIRQVVGFAPLQAKPWVLGVEETHDDFAVPFNKLIWQYTSIVLVVGFGAIAISLLLARNITRPIRTLISAAHALERDEYDHCVVELQKTLVEQSHSHDDIGQLIKVFLKMSEEIRLRSQRLKMQVLQLHVEIDETRRAAQVAEITETEHFRQLEHKIQKLKQRVSNKETETEYYQRLQGKVEVLKERMLNGNHNN
ncbi:MAG: HAMP domain-containing protein [Aetokthonos hydrillicola CCALA 1050]|jgi:C4-dicarboxylate-specific signal transduction histidine kinase|nr:HAMP domain-containing protein [Aetokthonos hydrillicola CCALA 1050]MBW4588005.1 HAMP domain-containing protein [Aetokthonos hydrillicola CCALA 1050]